MLVDTYNQNGEKVGQTQLPKEVFEIPLNSDLVHQVVVSQMANRRQVIAHTKDRSEVRGGGKKPWRQKGTGRARHGSIRSPLWRGGGVTFGPTKARVFKKIIPRKMRRKALLMVLSAKAREKLIIVLEQLQLAKAKTKEIAEILKKLPCEGKSCLIVLPTMDKTIILSARNLFRVETIQAKDLNPLLLLTFKYLLMPKESIKVMRETFLESEKRKTKIEKPQDKSF